MFTDKAELSAIHAKQCDANENSRSLIRVIRRKSSGTFDEQFRDGFRPDGSPNLTDLGDFTNFNLWLSQPYDIALPRRPIATRELSDIGQRNVGTIRDEFGELQN